MALLAQADKFDKRRQKAGKETRNGSSSLYVVGLLIIELHRQLPHRNQRIFGSVYKRVLRLLRESNWFGAHSKKKQKRQDPKFGSVVVTWVFRPIE